MAVINCKLDFIGDVHGCYDELTQLIEQIGYHEGFHPKGRKLVFIGDLTDRGPNSLQVIRLVSSLVEEKKSAYYIPGNHCDKLYRFFKGNKIRIKHGLETTVAEFHCLSIVEQRNIKQTFMRMYERATLYKCFDHQRIVAAHAGIRRRDIGKADKSVRSFVLYGDVDHHKQIPGEPPVRRDWASKENRQSPWIIYGHTPVSAPRILNQTINIDTGCVFGGQLTAFHYPELEFSAVDSFQPYFLEKFHRTQHSESLISYKEGHQ